MERLIASIHAKGGGLVLVVTGAGGPAVGWLMSVAGCTNVLLEALVPYSKLSLAEFIGKNDKSTMARNQAIKEPRTYTREICITGYSARNGGEGV